MKPSNEVPYYTLLDQYISVKKLHTEARIDLVVGSKTPAAAGVTFIDALATGFGRSIEQVRAQYASVQRIGEGVNGRASAPGTPPAVLSPKTATSRRIAKAAHNAGGIEVPTAPELSTTYVGFELSPLRTSGGASFAQADGMPDLPSNLPRAGNAVRIDLVGRTTSGLHLPVVQEVKVGADSDPPIALLQALAYTAALCPSEQYARLQHHYGELPRLDQPRFDVQIIVAGKIPSERSRRRCLWHVMPNLISRLQERPEITAHVRNISGIRLNDGWEQSGGPLQATPIDWDNPR